MAAPITPEEIKAESRRAVVRKSVQKWRLAHPEENRARVKKWASENPEKKLSSTRAWVAANPDRHRAAKNSWWSENKDRVREKERLRRECPSSRMEKLVTTAKSRARLSGLAFDESLRKTLSADPPQKCKCCSADLDYSLLTGRPHNLSPSLDRVDNSRGYTAENVRVICLRCNTLKRDASEADLELILAYMRS